MSRTATQQGLRNLLTVAFLCGGTCALILAIGIVPRHPFAGFMEVIGGALMLTAWAMRFYADVRADWREIRAAWKRAQS